MRNEDRDALRGGAALLQIPLDDRQLESFARYTELLYTWNERVNLTRIPIEKCVPLQLLDSLLLHRAHPLDRVRSLIDVGTGAGFPGIPVAIAFPEIEVTVIDSTRKKIDFIRTAVREIGLTNVKALHLRAEDGARDPALRESFDLATARAVAALDLLLEWLLPFVRVGGAAVALKGDSVDEELPAAKDIAPKLGGALLAPERFNIPMSAIERSFVVARKDSRCSATYPRPATQARKRH